MGVIEQLQQLGFTQYEARAYVALLQRHPLTGYELAQASGIPRPNIYPLLRKLEERGAVVRMEAAEGTRYSPVASDELVERLRQNFHASLEAAQQSLQNLQQPLEHDHFWNASGYAAVVQNAQGVIDAAEKALLVAVWPDESQVLSPAIQRAQERGVEVTTLCMAGCPQKCSACQGKVHRYPVAPQPQARWLVLIPDEAELLAGEITPTNEAQALRTRQKMMVSLAAWYIRHSIALALVLQEAGSQIEALLSPETRQSLSALSPAPEAEDWLAYMRRLLRSTPEENLNENP